MQSPPGWRRLNSAAPKNSETLKGSLPSIDHRHPHNLRALLHHTLHLCTFVRAHPPFTKQADVEKPADAYRKRQNLLMAAERAGATTNGGKDLKEGS
jgi:hypothetical protein